MVGSKAAVDLKTTQDLDRVASSRTPVQIVTPAEEGLRELLAAGSSVERTEGDYRYANCGAGISDLMLVKIF